MKPGSDNLDDFLIADSVIDWGSPAVLQTTFDLTKSLSDEVERVRVLYEWVRDSIPHSNDAGIDLVTCAASEVLQHRTGICFAKSHLLAAMLRAIRIPAGFCYQVLRLDPPVNNQLVLHGFNGVYLPSLDKWIRIDPRGNTGGIDAQFSTDKEQLAFPMDPSAGEFIYETIFAAPAKTVVDRLRKHTSRRELWQDLPEPF